MTKRKLLAGQVRLEAETYRQLRKMAIDSGHGSFTRLASEILTTYLANTVAEARKDKVSSEKRAQ